MNNTPSVTILIPNFKTPELTKCCFRLLNKNTEPGEAEFIVIDNDSQDASLDYLRTLSWIDLIERHDLSGENGPQMHASALDLALEKVKTEFVLVIHTDTLVLRSDWLDYLLGIVRSDEKIGGVGSWKLEHVSPGKRFLKKIEDVIRRLLGRKMKHEDRYLRSHCALYRTDLIRKYTHGFNDNDTAGHSIHRILTEKGYEMKFLSSDELGKYICHLNHATGILNPDKSSRKNSKPKARNRLRKNMALFENILSQDELDKRIS